MHAAAAWFNRRRLPSRAMLILIGCLSVFPVITLCWFGYAISQGGQAELHTAGNAAFMALLSVITIIPAVATRMVDTHTRKIAVEDKLDEVEEKLGFVDDGVWKIRELLTADVEPPAPELTVIPGGLA